MKINVRQCCVALSSVRLLLIAAVLLVLLAATAYSDPDAISEEDTPVGQIITVKLFTNLLRPLKSQDYERVIDIYLPAAYVNDVSKTQRFPVIYLLHGSPGYPKDFTSNGHWQIYLEQTAAANGFVAPILVAPDGNYTQAAFGDSEWLNSDDGQNRFEDFVVDQVVPWIDQHYRTIANAQGRVIGGVSEGGYGAVNIALHNPTVFSNVLALSGYYNNDGSGWARKMMGHNQEFLAYNSPLVFINSGEAEQKYASDWLTQHYFIGSGLDENRYTTESAEMVDELRDHGISAEICQVDGKHSWALWNTLFVSGISNIFVQHRRLTTTMPLLPRRSSQ